MPFTPFNKFRANGKGLLFIMQDNIINTFLYSPLSFPLRSSFPIIITFLVISLIWGSFLNVVGYRLILGQSITGRSRCPHCNHTITWYDLIPIISFVLLGGKCRTCHKPISWLYPFVELLTAIIMTALCLTTPTVYIPAYIIFFSALIVTIRSDIETMLISRYATVFLIPLGILLSSVGLLPITGTESVASAIVGSGLLWLIGKIFYVITGKVGMGQGDVDLLAFIGSFIGLVGLWVTIMTASLLGSIFGLSYMLATGTKHSVRIPFGPFLALGAIGYVLYAHQLIPVLFGM